ncbi:uncharacterized protein J4E78_007232 [Alternaria triticimaculans]|uniref:uncharacterized protein n=1 Tax=Alternaria triticimaculans TaxID=297637 RepID=UPI0020C5313A|nr:uncharacterized protein J4E78_007232 [Alternaria triticimaculans]KAI4654187.1 hypothetical protein J4E78_007232 [Alternaria triticimaculans]
MEHLKLPYLEGFSVTNFGNKYDSSVSFQNFPGKVGWAVTTASGELKEEEVNGVSRKPELEFKELMQSWLFFGLITAVVYDDNNIDKWELVASDFDPDDKGTLTTRELPRILEDWRKREISQDGKPGQKMRMIRAQLALDLARKVVNTYCSADSPKRAARLLDSSEEGQKAARKKAIHQIYTVFSGAKYTIVVDNGLSGMSWDNQDYTTTAMRILASGWMRRLWTLQEAYLSRKLLFAFKHLDEDDDESKCPPLIDLDEIEAWYHEGSPSLVSDLPALARSYYNNLLGPDRNARNNKDITTDGMSLIASVWRAAQWRNTSHNEHETLALATLLNLDLSNKSFGTANLMKPGNNTNLELDTMMKDFWLSLEESSPGSIPPGIIFLPGPRIQISAFGWAPKSWMLAHGPDYPDPVALSRKAAVLSPEYGLQVEFPGFLLHCEDRDAILGHQTNGTGFRFPCDNSLTEYYRVTWDETEEYSKQRGIIGEQRSEDLAIILCRPRPGQFPEIGLLVEIHTTKQEKRDLGQDSVRRVFAVYMRRRVKVRRETGDLNLATKVKEIMNRAHEEQSRIICGEILNEDQKWIVDCRIDSAKKISKEQVATRSATPVRSTRPSWANPNDVLSLLLIIGGDIVQTALAQTTAGGWITPVCFSFGWVAYSFSTLVRVLGDGRLLPPPDFPAKVFNLESSYVRENKNWVLGRILRDNELFMNKIQPHGGNALRISIYTAVERKNGQEMSNVYTLWLWVGVTLLQIGIASIPLGRDGEWGVFLVTCSGIVASILAGALPQWRIEKIPLKKESRKLIALTSGNGSRDIMIIYGDRKALDLEELAAGESPRSDRVWEALNLFSTPVKNEFGLVERRNNNTEVRKTRMYNGLPLGVWLQQGAPTVVGFL